MTRAPAFLKLIAPAIVLAVVMWMVLS